MEHFQLIYIFTLVVGLGIFVRAFNRAKTIRAITSQDKYNSFEGKIVKFVSAQIDGQRYGNVIEFKVGSELIGIKCYFPSFNMVASYEEIILSKSRALIGSLIQIQMPSSRRVIISHRLAKKLDTYSNGRLGYGKI